MFGRKPKDTSSKPTPQAADSPLPETVSLFGSHLANRLENGPTSSDLLVAIDRLKSAENPAVEGVEHHRLEGVEQAVETALQEFEVAINEPGPAAEAVAEPAAPEKPAPLGERWIGFYAAQGDALEIAEQNLVTRMATDAARFEAQCLHDREELRQIQLSKAAIHTARAVIEAQIAQPERKTKVSNRLNAVPVEPRPRMPRVKCKLAQESQVAP